MRSAPQPPLKQQSHPISKVMQIRFMALAILLLLSTTNWAQKLDKNELEGKKKDLQEEISYTNKLLDETKKNKKLSLNQLVTLNKKISAREELISTISYEIAILNKQSSFPTTAAASQSGSLVNWE